MADSLEVSDSETGSIPSGIFSGVEGFSHLNFFNQNSQPASQLFSTGLPHKKAINNNVMNFVGGPHLMQQAHPQITTFGLSANVLGMSSMLQSQSSDELPSRNNAGSELVRLWRELQSEQQKNYQLKLKYQSVKADRSALLTSNTCLETELKVLNGFMSGFMSGSTSPLSPAFHSPLLPLQPQLPAVPLFMQKPLQTSTLNWIDYPGIKYWYKHEWVAACKLTKHTGDGKGKGEALLKAEGQQEGGDQPLDDIMKMEDKERRKEGSGRGKTQSSQGINVRLQYLEDEFGGAVDGFFVSNVRAYVQSLWVSLAKHGLAPETWSSCTPEVANAFQAEMEHKFPILALCTNHWKSDWLWTENYLSWYSYDVKKNQEDDGEDGLHGPSRASLRAHLRARSQTPAPAPIDVDASEGGLVASQVTNDPAKPTITPDTVVKCSFIDIDVTDPESVVPPRR
ncbi:hypothetical protein C0991_009879 [Blastosporella zonata]|nr:hypothetical protein C0991_009879 [Blastosporella zonata]